MFASVAAAAVAHRVAILSTHLEPHAITHFHKLQCPGPVAAAAASAGDGDDDDHPAESTTTTRFVVADRRRRFICLSFDQSK